jgi:hypothetical protein
LEGSLQRGGNRLRLNVQLIDATPGLTSGPNGSTKNLPICSRCRTTDHAAPLIALDFRRVEAALPGN